MWLKKKDYLALTKQIDVLRSVCAEAYQLAGAYRAPVNALDNLSAAARGNTRLPHKSFLPVTNQFEDDIMLFNWLLTNCNITRDEIRRQIATELQEACSGGLASQPLKPPG